MHKKIIFEFVMVAVLAWSGNFAHALEKLNFGTPTRTSPHYVLPALAAEEKGFWKEQGLEVTWVPFDSGALLIQGFAARAVHVGLSGLAESTISIARGVPVILAGDLKYVQPWYLVALTGSKIKTPEDLKGAKIAISRSGSLPHIYGRVAAKELGLEGSVKFIATGGVPQAMAALKAGTADVLSMSLGVVANLLYAGEIRVVVETSKYIPKGQGDTGIATHRDFARKSPETVKRALSALVKTADFINRNEEWAVQKMISASGFTPEAARALAPRLKFSTDIKIDPKLLAEVQEFLVNYELLPRQEALAIKELFTNEYAP